MAAVTILAFVYVPLNLATSIFGMNIYQLNGSGQNLSIFLATALIALFVTGGAWYLIEQVNSYRKWRETRLKKDDCKPTKYTLMTRINMLVWLLWSPHRYWMIEKGIWWRLLTNSSSRLCLKSEPYRRDRSWPTAADFVWGFSIVRPNYGREYGSYYRNWVWKSGSTEEPSFEESSEPPNPLMEISLTDPCYPRRPDSPDY